MNQIKKNFAQAKAIYDTVTDKCYKLFDKKYPNLDDMTDKELEESHYYLTSLFAQYKQEEAHILYKEARDQLFDWAAALLKKHDPVKFKKIEICFEPLNRITYQDKIIDICMRLEG